MQTAHVTTQTLPDVLHVQSDARLQLPSPCFRARSLTAETYHALGSSQENRFSQSSFVLQASHLPKTRSSRYALFVIYTWNREVLYTAVRSYAAAGFSKNLIVLDNTDNSTLRDDPVIAELAAEVISTRTVLTFSQAQNFMAGEGTLEGRPDQKSSTIAL